MSQLVPRIMLDPIEINDFACLAHPLAVDEDVSRSLDGMEDGICARNITSFFGKGSRGIAFLVLSRYRAVMAK